MTSPTTDRTEIRLQGPKGEERVIDLEREDVTVGRAMDGCEVDIPLDDPSSLISRLHCVFDNEWGTWWVTDNASRNGTFVRRDGEVTRVTGRTRLDDGDEVLVAGLLDGDNLRYWVLEVRDPNTTVRIPSGLPGAAETGNHVRWDGPQQRLEVVIGGDATVVELRRQGYLLVDHMARINEENGAAVVVPPDELLEAIWGPSEDWDRYHPPTIENLRDIVSTVRRAIEPDTSSPILLENLRGIGYRLHTRPR